MTATQAAVEAVFRIESPRLIAGLARIVRDVGVAEDLAQDAMVSALERWPRDGVPANPGAWLMTTAKHRAIDRLRHLRRVTDKHAAIEAESPVADTPDLAAALDDELGDDLLRLIFTCCHPILAEESRVALTLRVVGGLTTDEIARAYLVESPTIAQRIVRAKRALEGVPYELPHGPELEERLASVLSVIYLVFNEGYAATAGDHWMRPALCEDALRLARVVASAMPAEPEVHGLAALLELTYARSAARVGPDGEPVLLLDQDRRHWDHAAIRRGLASLARAEQLGGTVGPYALQAAIAACHARARVAADTDWRQIAALYEVLGRVAPSPIVELNRAVALAMAFGPAMGLTLCDALMAEPALATYHLLPSVRGDLLAKLGRHHEARSEFLRAADLTRNLREKELLMRRAAELPS